MLSLLLAVDNRVGIFMLYQLGNSALFGAVRYQRRWKDTYNGYKYSYQKYYWAQKY